MYSFEYIISDISFEENFMITRSFIMFLALVSCSGTTVFCGIFLSICYILMS